MKGFIIALQFLTRLPTPAVAADGGAFARSMHWFPAVGVVIGALVAGAAWAGAHLDPRLGALAALIVWVGVTGALHLDGLGDLADASGAAHKDRERVLAVLADPHVGSFGVVAIVLQLIAKLVLLGLLVEARAFVGLMLVPFAARIGPLVWSWWLEPLHQGLAARFRSATARRSCWCGRPRWGRHHGGCRRCWSRRCSCCGGAGGCAGRSAGYPATGMALASK